MAANELETLQELEAPGPPPSLDEVFADSPTMSSVAREFPSDNYRVSLPTFEGPLDLLLHLIRKEQMDIYDIPIANICRSYLDYVTLLELPDMDLAGEFLVMATTLMQIKSQMLLPKDDEEDEEDDPRLPLVAQLLEYERFQKAAQQINEEPWLGRDVFARPQSATRDLMPKESLLEAEVDPIDTFKLLLGLKNCLDRTEKPPVVVQRDETSLKEKVGEITEALTLREVVEWRQFVPKAPKPFDVIVAFLSILELAKLKFIGIVQHENFGPIQLRRKRDLKELSVNLLDQY